MGNSIEEFYKNKKVLITGHTGFKGSWLTLWLIQMGARVAGYSLEPNTDPSLFHILKLEHDIDHTIADIRDADKLQNAFDRFKPEIVFHLAAQPLVRYSFHHPKETYETNVMGTVNLLDAVKATDSVKAVVCITSDKCYENKEWVFGYRENDPMGGHDPYSSSKGCAELVIASYRSTYFNPQNYGSGHHVALASARAGNVIGGGDWSADRLVPDCVRYLVKDEEIILRNPDAVRPWQHVLEPLYGYLILGKKNAEDPSRYCEAWNFGPNDSEMIPVKELVAKIIEYWERGSYRVKKDDTIHEANLLKLDISKARSILNWCPRLNFDQALKWTILCYMSYYDKKEMLEICRQQIRDYMGIANK